MKTVNVNLAERSYPIYITTAYDDIGKCVEQMKVSGKIIVVTDSNVYKYHSESCIKSLEARGFEVYKYIIEAGEKSKNLDTVNDIYKFLIGLKADRDSMLVALGGGVVGDITGFVAATFLRGIAFIGVPTSLLAQVDSSVGGKVGVDFEGSKNIIGSFYQPKFVYINVNSLKTLPKREFVSGLSEVIKHGIIDNKDFFEYIEFHIDDIFNFNESVLEYMVQANCTIKGRIVEMDEKESSIRAILNFGHTIGHAVESVMDFKLLHGECVSVGMTGAFKLAVRLGLAKREDEETVVNMLKSAGLPTSVNGIDVDRVYSQMFFDKKIKNNKLTFILPRRIGEVVKYTVEDEKMLKEVISELA